MNEASVPRLAPPGAGLPPLELFVGRVLFGWRWRTGSREKFNAAFQAERARVRELLRGVDAVAGAQRVLISRVRGLEDSSRHWSVWMTLEHLRIVQTSAARIITSLGQGVVPSGKASTAAVKPGAEATIAVVEAYEASCEAVLAAAAGVTDLKTSVRFAHPWFGPLDAAGWHALAGGHLRIHRVQIERILEGRAAAKS